MCVIISIPNKANVPTKEVLEQCETRNKDGGGIAWIKNNQVHWHKGVNLEAMLACLPEIPNESPIVMHFRIATAGGVSPELCHPFPVTEDAPVALAGHGASVLFHNGVWYRWEERMLDSVISGNRQMPPGGWSDSRAMAYLAAHHGQDILSLINEKVVVLDSDGPGYYGRGWEKRGEVWFSNTHWDLTNFSYSWKHEMDASKPKPKTRTRTKTKTRSGSLYLDSDRALLEETQEHFLLRDDEPDLVEILGDDRRTR